MSSAPGGCAGGGGSGASGCDGDNGGNGGNDDDRRAGRGTKRTCNDRLDPFETSMEEFDREAEQSPEPDTRPDPLL